jgi:hypothetical protein
MEKVLLISNHKVLNDIYTVNFQSYLDCKIDCYVKLDDALMDSDIVMKDYKLIISLSYIDQVDVALLLGEELDIHKSKEQDLIILGNKSDIVPGPNITILDANFNIASILSICAKKLGVTAKDMANKEILEYIPFSLKTLQSIKKSPVDFYVQSKKASNDEIYTKCILKGESIQAKAQIYLELELTYLYINASMRLELTNFITASLTKTLDDEELDFLNKIEVLESGFNLVANGLDENSSISKDLAELSQKCIETLQSGLDGDESLTSLLDKLLNNNAGYVFTHSVLSSYVSNHIIDQINWGIDEHKDKINFVLFFHDLFLTPIFDKYPDFSCEEDVIFSNKVSNEEKEMVLGHAAKIAEVIKSFPRCPMGSDVILLQHHGTSNGLGFTIDYKDDISPLAKVIIIAEAFVETFLEYKDREKDERDLLIQSKLSSKFKRHTYKKLISTLDTIKL